MRVFVCSDTHLGHNKDFLYAPRGFTNIQEHNEAIVKNWNSEITDDDIVYHLGDVVLGDIDTGIEYLKRLKGQIKIIPGNHDTPSKIDRYQELENVEVLPLAYLLKYKKYMAAEWRRLSAGPPADVPEQYLSADQPPEVSEKYLQSQELLSTECLYCQDNKLRPIKQPEVWKYSLLLPPFI